MAVLSKSRFKVGLECPNKLYFSHFKDLYPSQKTEDTFLQSLAQGGFQVEELARLHYPGGVMIEAPHYDYDGAVQQTNELLQRENVVIYEAAFLWNDLFVRTDVLEKKGNRIKIIEVKAKLYDPDDDFLFIGKNGGLSSSWKPYLFDLAFQTYVVKKAHPHVFTTSHFMLPDKTKQTSVDGLNQMFRIPAAGEGDQRFDVVRLVHSLDQAGDHILSEVPVESIIRSILNDEFAYHEGLKFLDAIDLLRKTYQEGNYPNWPTNYTACNNCEFKATPAELEEGKQSGFYYCMRQQHGWMKQDYNRPNIFDIWDLRGNKPPELLQENRLFQSQITENDLKVEPKPHEISRTHRQWIQVQKSVLEDSSIFVMKDELRAELNSWEYPLHFIDFETSSVALPFSAGRRPYEQVAFQCSHHLVDEHGNVHHQTEFLSTEAGKFPNFEFTRALKNALCGDHGSIFMFSNHENTILNAIYRQLLESDEPDKEHLIEFLKSISKPTGNSVQKWEPNRPMIDLRKTVLKYYYNPLTNGSNSIKFVLPAVLNSCTYLQQKYVQPISEIGLSSLNFSKDHVWLVKEESDRILSPYKLLPELFTDWTVEEIESNISGISELADGGAALTAYAKLQYQDMTTEEREALDSGLKKYCELDTLAMVMIYEHFRELVT